MIGYVVAWRGGPVESAEAGGRAGVNGSSAIAVAKPCTCFDECSLLNGLKAWVKGKSEFRIRHPQNRNYVLDM